MRSDPSHQYQDQNHDKDDPQDPRWPRAPSRGVRPGWQGGNQQDCQDNEYDCSNGHGNFPFFATPFSTISRRFGLYPADHNHKAFQSSAPGTFPAVASRVPSEASTLSEARQPPAGLLFCLLKCPIWHSNYLTAKLDIINRLEAEMGVLFFVCPATGQEVSTHLDVDPESYVTLASNGEAVSCPHCSEPHVLSELQSWTVEPRRTAT